MSDTEPTLNWEDAPGHFKEAHKRVRGELDKAREQLGEVDTLKRQNAFLRAGLDTEHPGFSFFDAGYTGKLDTDEIRQTWETTFGSSTPAPPAADQEQPTNDDGSNPDVADQLTRLQQDRAKLHTDAVAPGEEPSPDPQVEAIRIFHQRQREGATRPQATGAAFDHIFAAANAGDPRVVSESAEEAQRKWRMRNGFE